MILKKIAKIAEGEPWDQQGLEAPTMMLIRDIRAYYEELALEIADGPIAAYGAERWFFDETEAGKVLIHARRSMQQAGAPHPQWF